MKVTVEPEEIVVPPKEIVIRLSEQEARMLAVIVQLNSDTKQYANSTRNRDSKNKEEYSKFMGDLFYALKDSEVK